MTLRPTIVSAKTTASVDDALAVLSSRDTKTPGEVCHSILKELVGSALLVVDGQAGRIYGTTDVDTMAAFVSCYTSLESVASRLQVVPDVYRLLAHWTVTEDVSWPFDSAAYFHAANRRSLAHIVQWLAGDGAGGWRANVFVLIDQTSATVLAFIPFDALAVSVALDEITVAGQSLCFKLAPKYTEILPFE